MWGELFRWEHKHKGGRGRERGLEEKKKFPKKIDLTPKSQKSKEKVWEFEMSMILNIFYSASSSFISFLKR